MNRLRLAVVGVGALGRHHARILAGMPDVELTGVADLNLDAARRIAEAHRTVALSDYRELFERVDAVTVAVPTSAHLPVAAAFLQRKIPVMVEKPLAADVAEAEHLVQLAAAHNTFLQVGHVERFNPATAAAWKLCGPVRYIRAERVSPCAFRSMDIGVVHDLMIHDIDLVLDLVRAPVQSVEAFGANVLGGVHEDVATARLHFQNGCIADLTAARVCPAARRGMQIWSADRCVTVDFATRELAAYSKTDALRYGRSPAELAREPGADLERLKQDLFGKYVTIERPAVSDADALTAELRSFIDCVRGGVPPVVDGRQGLAAMQVAQQVLEGIARNERHSTHVGSRAAA